MTTEQTIRDFISFLFYRTANRNTYRNEGKIQLQKFHEDNHSSNNYWRELTNSEEEELITEFLDDQLKTKLHY